MLIYMEKSMKDKLNVLDPNFKKSIEELFEKINFSVEMLYEAATHDKKTNVYNYEFYKTIFEMEFEKAKRGIQNLSLLILDIDFFKKINDTYGHTKADDMLIQMAKIMKKEVRKSDIVARFGGEEFVVLLPGTNAQKATKVVQRLKNKIQSDKFLSKYKLTVSGGLTEYQEKDTPKKMQERSDKALYEAKESGRDKIVLLTKNKKKEIPQLKQKLNKGHTSK